MIQQTLARGPLFIASTLVAMLSLGCKKDTSHAEWWQGEQERIALVHQVDLKQYRINQINIGGFEEVQRLGKLTQSQTELLDALRWQRKDLTEQLASLQTKWTELKEATIRDRRNRAIGRTFKSFESAAGRKFQEVSIVGIDDAGVTIRHADGSARLRFADLDPEQQIFFGLEADLAFAAEERESLTSMAYERGIERQLVAIEAREKMDAETARLDEWAPGRKLYQTTTRHLATPKQSPLAKEATPIGRRSWYDFGYYPRYRSRSSYSSSRYVYYYKIPSYYGSQWQLDSPQVNRIFGSR